MTDDLYELDPVLNKLVRICQEGKGDGRIWVSVPGAVISGRLTHIDNFKPVFTTLPWMHEIIKHEQRRERRRPGRNPIETIELLDVTITNGPAVIRRPWARVIVDEIAAWGVEPQAA